MASSTTPYDDASEIGSIFSEGVEFDGLAQFSRPILVNCVLKGEIRSDSDIFVSTDAQVAAKVEAKRISVKGSMDGEFHAHERVELFSTARVAGTVHTADMVMQSGAVLNARCIMDSGTTKGGPTT